MNKHPISRGQDDEFTTCWREHRPGYVCILPEGHPEGEDRDAATDAAYEAIKPLGTWSVAVLAVEAARPVIIREEHARLVAIIQEEIDKGTDPAVVLGLGRVGLTWTATGAVV